MYAQDPTFSELDKRFLKHLGFTILEDPAAEDLVDGESILFVPHLEWITEEPYRKKANKCPLYITSRMEWVTEAAEETKARLEAR